MFPTPIIRPALPSDAEALIHYMTALVNEPNNNVVRDPGQWTMTVEEERTHLQNCAAAPDSKLFLVADIAGAIVGVADISRMPRPTARHAASLGISVAAAHRRQGLGLALMHALLDWAKSQKLRRVELKVFTRNTPAIALYQKLGFVQEGLHRMVFLKQGQWIDEYTMALLLD